jgi:hypothetical protein
MESFDPSVGRRPMGLWVLAVCNWTIAVELAWGPIWVLSVLYGPVPADVVLGPHAELQAWMMLAALAGICVFTIGALIGAASARVALLLLVAVITLLGMWDSYQFSVWYRSEGYTLNELTWFGFWNGSIGVRFLVWFGANLWILVRSWRFFT